jgi:NAD(P)H-dependent FMN reductase
MLRAYERLALPAFLSSTTKDWERCAFQSRLDCEPVPAGSRGIASDDRGADAVVISTPEYMHAYRALLRMPWIG